MYATIEDFGQNVEEGKMVEVHMKYKIVDKKMKLMASPYEENSL